MCGLEIRYEEKEVLSIKGDKKDPFSRGHICPKAVGLKDIYEDPDRLKSPVRKTATGWEPISWEDAYEEVVRKIQDVQKKFGKDAVGSYLGNPNVHNLGSMLFLPAFLKSLKSKNRFSATSVDQLPHHFAARLQFGHQFMIPIPDVDRTDYMLIMGANPLVSNGSLMTAPDIGKRLRAIQERGGKVVVIDPRYTETARKASQHYFIRPGEDALFLLAILHTIFEKQQEKPGRLKELLHGWEEIKTIVKAYSPEKVSKATGLSAQQIRSIAQEFAAAPSAVCYGRMGLSTQAYGGLCQWLVNVVNIVTGNLDREGGAMFTLPAYDHVGITGAMGRTGAFDRWQSRVRGLSEFGGELPVAALAEEILTKGDGQIKAMVTVAGNPVLSTPNGKQLDQALAQLDFMVAIDIYINETTRHADIILPPATGLEVDHYDLIFHVLAIRNTAKYSTALFEIEDHQRFDWQIMDELAHRLSGKPRLGFSPRQIIDGALAKGPYASQALSISKLIDHPHGIDLGPLRPCLPERLLTPDKKIDLVPKNMLQDLDRLNQHLQEELKETNYPFRLIGRRLLRSNNSWMHNVQRLVKGPEACTLLLHPKDAAQLEVDNGQVIKVQSRVGQIRIPVEISEEIMEGVVSIPHGFGHANEGVQLQVATKRPGVSINDLTDEQLIDRLTGNVAFSGVPVQLLV